ncbi:MAG: CvpA family protein [Sphingobium sp.]|nr:CvpA family protein [Sphingobium sp.]
MATFDIVVLLVVGAFGVRGLMKGFVKEVLALCAVVAGIVAVRLLHGSVTNWVAPHLGSEYVAALLALVLIFGSVFLATKLLASTISSQMRNVGLGFFDRVLGCGFGAIKGLLIVMVCYVGFIFVYHALYGQTSITPDWLRLSRSDPLLNAGSEAMSSWVAQNSRDGGLVGFGEHKAKPDGDAAPIDKAKR